MRMRARAPARAHDARMQVKDTSLEVWREEIFGPVISVMTFKSDDEKGAVALANDTHYGLAGAVFSKVR